MMTKGRRQSKNIQKVFGARERRHHTNRALKDMAIHAIRQVYGPRNTDTSAAKKMGVGSPSLSNIKGNRVRKVGPKRKSK